MKDSALKELTVEVTNGSLKYGEIPDWIYKHKI